MNKNRKIKRGLTTSLAVGMSVMMGTVPVFAAGTSSDADAVYKEETVYVNADATGTTDEVTVSNWLKNSGSVSGSLTDASTLKDIKNVKGDETFTTSGDTLTWNTDGEDIYYQGTTDQDLPVSVKLTYYLDGKEIKPADLKGKSGHLKIQVDYTNKEKKTVSVNGKQEEVYTPFVMMTGMILPNETFSNVTIDNGKVISDGSKNIVVGFGMPGMKDSLNLDESKTEDLTIPESLCVEADVTDFTMSSTFTVALTDLLDDIDFDNIVDIDSLQNSLDELEDAALQLVSGSNTLADGAGTLADGVNSYTEGADTLNEAIQKYLGSNGELSGSVTEYVNGVNKVVKGVQDYTDGTNTLADGVTAYIGGEQQLAAGAAKLSQLSSGLKTVQGAISQLNAATEDIQVAANQLAAGTAQLKAALGSKEVQALLVQVGNMLATGTEMINQTEQLGTALNDGIATPVQNIAANLTSLNQRLGTINQQLATLDTACQSKVDDLNAKIRDYNSKVDAAQNAAANSKATIESAISELQAKKDKTTDETAKTDLQTAIDKLNEAKSAADGLSGLEKASEVSVTIPTIDTTAIQQEMGAINVSMKTFQQTAQTLMTQLPAMQEKLQEITSMKEKLPTEAFEQLSTSVDQLNAGMQGLNAAIGSFSSNLGTLNESVQAQFPAAVTGILELNGGFSQLSANNDALLAGASKLKANSSTLIAGVQTLQSGTNQLASGLNTLGSQMSSGAAQLSLNSAALREGASALQSGARELADGMEKFDREGTSKLKSTVEDELGDVLDRFDALTSDDCTYTTFSGKDSGMEGTVKFVIETEAIE